MCLLSYTVADLGEGPGGLPIFLGQSKMKAEMLKTMKGQIFCGECIPFSPLPQGQDAPLL